VGPSQTNQGKSHPYDKGQLNPMIVNHQCLQKELFRDKRENCQHLNGITCENPSKYNSYTKGSYTWLPDTKRSPSNRTFATKGKLTFLKILVFINTNNIPLYKFHAQTSMLTKSRENERKESCCKDIQERPS
jgi:hypothetical protein